MNGKTNRRKFIQMAAVTGAGFSIINSLPTYAGKLVLPGKPASENSGPAFIPNRCASWWCTLEDIQWP
jgi:hypothetical protein